MAPAPILNTSCLHVDEKKSHHRESSVSDPQLKPDDVLVNVKYATRCDTLLSPFKVGEDHGIVERHVGVGVVIAIGEKVEDINVGDTVGAQLLNGTCGTCLECNGFDNRLFCENIQLLDLAAVGTLQTHWACQASEIVRVPENIPLDAVPPILSAGGTIERALAMSSVSEGQIIGIVGALGNLGSLACQYAQSLGFQVLAILSEEETADSQATSMDADYVVHCKSSANLLSEIQLIIPRGLPAILVCEASAPPFQFAPQIVRPCGKIILVGISPDDLMQLDFPSVIQRAVSIQWAWAGAKSDTEKVLRHVSDRKLHIPRHIEIVGQSPRVESTASESTLPGWTILELPRPPTDTPSNGHSAKPETFNFGQYLVHRLVELGIKDIFAVPGDSNLNLLDVVLETKRLNYIGCCNELNAGYAADGYARTSNSGIAVLIVPFVVGSLSALNAICGAFTDRQKIIVISGCPVSTSLGSNKHLHHTPGANGLDVALHAYQDMTAASLRITNTDDAVDTLDHALRECIHQSLPIFIEVAHDVAYTVCHPPTRLFPLRDSTAQPPDHRGVVRAFMQAWQSARMPVILIGPWVYRSCSHETLMTFVERLGCAVLVQPDARAFPESHPQFCGGIWPSISNPSGTSILLESDLWVMLGGRWCDLHLAPLDIDKQSNRLLDLQPDSARMLLEQESPIILQDLLLDLVGTKFSPNSQSLIEYHERIPKTILSSSCHELKTDSPVTLSNITDEVNRLIQGQDTLFVDAGETWFLSQDIKLPPGATCQVQVVYASLGWSLPAALGGQVARPMGRSILLVGDGAFQMTTQEVSTMIRHKLNPVIFVLNNLGYQIEIAIQDGIYNYFANWDYARLATCYSHPPHSGTNDPYSSLTKPEKEDSFLAFQVYTHADLRNAVTQAQKESSKLCLIDCCLQSGDITDSLREMGNRFAPDGEGHHTPTRGSSSHNINSNGVNGVGSHEDQLV